jgi:SPP1 gp7 family putative phage head morphogenesis protein
VPNPGFHPPKGTEKRYTVALRKVARIVGGMIMSHVDGPTVKDMPKLLAALRAYEAAIEPWAESIASGMLADVQRANRKAWLSKTAGRIHRALKAETPSGPMAGVVELLHRRQVELIKSIPAEAAERAQKLAREGAIGGDRAAKVAQQLADSEGVALSSATRIARTEISKTNTAITRARCDYLGIRQYIWRTMNDGHVRPSHDEMEGKVCDFDNPPTLSDGMTGNAGDFPNDRCYPEPIITERE